MGAGAAYNDKLNGLLSVEEKSGRNYPITIVWRFGYTQSDLNRKGDLEYVQISRLRPPFTPTDRASHLHAPAELSSQMTDGLYRGVREQA